jgi:hypothetical protein
VILPAGMPRRTRLPVLASGCREASTYAGEEIEIARDGVPVARLVRVEPATPGSRFLAARGTLAGSIAIGEDFELSDAEIDAMVDDSA